MLDGRVGTEREVCSGGRTEVRIDCLELVSKIRRNVLGELLSDIREIGRANLTQVSSPTDTTHF